MGVVVQLGGQTPLRLARGLEAAGVPILGTSPDAIDEAEDRGRFEAMARELGRGAAAERHRHVGGGGRGGGRRASAIRSWSAPRMSWAAGPWRSSTTSTRSQRYFAQAVRVAPEHPVLIDSFLEDAFEADVDAICRRQPQCVIGGVMQHIEDAGIHSGDSACVLPPYLITEDQVEEMRQHTRAFALRLGVVGLINVQYAIKHGQVYVLEVNPRGSRTVPFVSKTTGVPLAGAGGGRHGGPHPRRPRAARRRAPALRGGQGGGLPLQQAARAWISSSGRRCAPPARSWALPTRSGWRSPRPRSAPTGRCRSTGAVFVTVNDHDKQTVVPIARRFHELGFRIVATEGTARYLRSRGMPAERVLKVHEGRPNAIDLHPVGRCAAADQHARSAS